MKNKLLNSKNYLKPKLTEKSVMKIIYINALTNNLFMQLKKPTDASPQLNMTNNL